MGVLDVKWYHYYTYWIFAWFILYKLKIVPYSPSYNYIMTMIVISIISVRYILLYDNILLNEKYINYGIIIFKLLEVFITDFIPFIMLYPFQLDYKTLQINIIVLFIYLLYIVNSNVTLDDIYLNKYSVMFNIKNMTFMKFLKLRGYMSNSPL